MCEYSYVNFFFYLQQFLIFLNCCSLLLSVHLLCQAQQCITLIKISLIKSNNYLYTMYPVFNIFLRQTRYCQVSNLVICSKRLLRMLWVYGKLNWQINNPDLPWPLCFWGLRGGDIMSDNNLYSLFFENILYNYSRAPIILT